MNSLECEYCYVHFDNRVDLLVHVQEEHLDIKPETFHRNHCPSTFVNDSQMLKHITKIHDDDYAAKNYGKICFVSGCTSPDKTFLTGPSTSEKAVNRDIASPSAKVCENHFELQNYNPKISADITPVMQKPSNKINTNERISESRTSPISHILSSIDQLTDMPDDKLEVRIEIEDSDPLEDGDPLEHSDALEDGDPLEDTDWCINDKANHGKKQQDCNFNEPNNNFLGYENIHNYKKVKNSYAIDEVGHKLNGSVIIENNDEAGLLKRRIDNIQSGSNAEPNKKSDHSLHCYENNHDVEIIVKIFECSACQASFLKEEDLFQHKKVLHGTNSEYRSSRTEDSLKHIKELINAKTKDHLKTDEEVLEKFGISLKNNTKYKGCEVESVETSPIKNNIRGRPKDIYTCTICQKEFDYKHWMGHMKEVHSDARYVCDICGSTFKCERYLRRHTLYRHENGVKPHQRNIKHACPECFKTFKNSDCLSHHINNCHGNKVECEICHSKLRSVSYLKTHMRRVHYNDGKIHKCKICFKQFKSPRQVKIHMINLHPESLHPCPNCVRHFCNGGLLKNHLKRCKPKTKIASADIITIDDDAEIIDVDLTVD